MGDFYLRHEYHFAALQLASAMLGIGATLTPAAISDVFRFPSAFGLGLALQLIVLPLIALTLIEVLALDPGVSMGIVLLAAVPGGTFSNLFTYFARANVALSVAVTAVTTVGCLVTTPIVLALLAAGQLPAAFAMPVGRIMFEITVCLLGPLALGMIIGHRLESRRAPFATWCIRGSLFTIGLMVIGSIAADRLNASTLDGASIAALALFAVSAQALALALSAATGLGRADVVALGLEVTVRNTNLGLLLKASIFPVVPGVPDPVADAVLFAVLMYGGIALLVALPIASLHRRRVGAPSAQHREQRSV